MSSTIEHCAEMEAETGEQVRAEIRRKRFEAFVRQAVKDGIPEIAARIRTDPPKPEPDADAVKSVFMKRTR